MKRIFLSCLIPLSFLFADDLSTQKTPSIALRESAQEEDDDDHDYYYPLRVSVGPFFFISK